MFQCCSKASVYATALLSLICSSVAYSMHLWVFSCFSSTVLLGSDSINDSEPSIALSPNHASNSLNIPLHKNSQIKIYKHTDRHSWGCNTTQNNCIHSLDEFKCAWRPETLHWGCLQEGKKQVKAFQCLHVICFSLVFSAVLSTVICWCNSIKPSDSNTAPTVKHGGIKNMRDSLAVSGTLKLYWMHASVKKVDYIDFLM